MIAVIDVEIQASNPCMPLYPWRAFKNSPSSLRIRNVPKKIGTWNITSVDVQVEYPNNQVLRESAKLVGGVWVCTIDGSNISGRTTNGYTVIASGVDEFGASITDYILGKGDVEILDSNSIIEAGLDANTIKIFNEQPTELNNGDAWFEEGNLVVYQDNTYHYLGSEFIPTNEQLAALNSGVTAEKLTNIELNISDAQSTAYSAQYVATAATDKVDLVEGLALEAWAKANNAETNSIRKYPLVSIGYLPDGMLLLESYQVTILNYGDVELVINGVNSTDGNTARDCILVVENIIGSDIQIDWPYNFHPRTDKETDFVCKSNTTNVYWISEYKANNFVVAGWQETTGGSN